MAIQDKSTLKSYFNTGDRPTESDFQELIDSAYNMSDDAHRLGAKTYDSSKTYEADDTCLYDDGSGYKLYRANTSTTSTFNPSDWNLISGGGDSTNRSNEYVTVAHVDFTNGDDVTAVLNAASKPFKNINTATSAVKAEVLSQGVGGKGLVVVRVGVYYESRINREFVDMYFEFGAIVISTEDGKPVITDTDGNDEPLNIKIKGKGQFYHQYYNPDLDNQAVATNNSNTKSFELEAYELDGIQPYGYPEQEFIFRNVRIRFSLDFWLDKTLKFYDCTFLSGLSLGHYYVLRTSVYCDGCEFILPSDGFDAHLDIKDIDGDVVETIEIGSSSYSPIDTTSLSRSDVKNTHYSSLSEPLLSGIYVNGTFPPYLEDFRVEVTNSIVRIRKEKCIGINITQTYTHSLANAKRAYYVFRNIHIEDETEGKDTTGLVAKKVNTATNTVPFVFSAITSNCAVFQDTSPYESDYIAIASQYDFSPDTAKSFGPMSLVDATNIAVDASLGNIFTVTLGGNRTLDNPINLVAGTSYAFKISQDGTGSRTLAFGTAYKFPSGVAPVLTTSADAMDILNGISFDGTTIDMGYLLDVK